MFQHVTFLNPLRFSIRYLVLLFILTWVLCFQVVEPTESEWKVYPEDDPEGMLTKLFVLPLLSALLRCFCFTQSAAALDASPPPVLGLLPEWPGVLSLCLGEPPPSCCPLSRWLLLQPFPEPQAPWLALPGDLSGLGEPSGELPLLLLLLLCSEDRLSTWGSRSKSVSGKWGRMTGCCSYTLGMREMVDVRRGLLLGLGTGVSSIKLITSSRLKHRSSSS